MGYTAEDKQYIFIFVIMSIEQSKEQLSGKPQGLAEHATDAVKNIQNLAGNVDIGKTFPRMGELMNIPGGDKAFREISDVSQICK